MSDERMRQLALEKLAHNDSKGVSVTAAVIYAAKSAEDTHGSIATQLADCRELAERQGWQVAGEFGDEAFSAFKGNRGPGLARAKALAVRLAEDGCAILVEQDAEGSPAVRVTLLVLPITWGSCTSPCAARVWRCGLSVPASWTCCGLRSRANGPPTRAGARARPSGRG